MIKKDDRFLLTSPINHKYVVEVRPFFTPKTDDMYDHIRNLWPNLYILHVSTIDLPTNIMIPHLSKYIMTTHIYQTYWTS